MAVNVELLNKVMEHIEAHPEEHDQSEWAEQTPCGTTYCFAGHAAIMAGWTPLFGEDGVAVSCAKPRLPPRNIDEVAAEELSLDDVSAGRLFFSCADLDMVRAEVALLIERAE